MKAVSLAVRTVRDSVDDRLPGLAAEMAFYVVLSLPPLALMVLGAAGFLADMVEAARVEEISAAVMSAASALFTESTVDDIVEPAVTGLLERGRGDILTLGGVLALWSGSRAARVMLQAVAIAYDLEQRPSWWRTRLLALGVTVVGAVGGGLVLPGMVIGPHLVEHRFGAAGLAIFWPLLGLAAIAALAALYHLATPGHNGWREDLPGALTAVALWVAGSWGLRVYAEAFVESNSAYTWFSAPLVLLLWVYVSSVALLIGAELNAEIEKLRQEEAGPR
jgi:membrane protein